MAARDELEVSAGTALECDTVCVVYVYGLSVSD